MSHLQHYVQRSALKAGINICGMMQYWRHSWHESTAWCLATEKYNCDECDTPILPGELYSQGRRQVFWDAPFDVYGVDRIHFKCTYEAKDGKETEESIIEKHPDLKKEPCFVGIVAILTGEMNYSKQDTRALIESNGGVVKDNITRQVTHMVVGRPGTTGYGQKTGPGSKKYKDGIKAKLIVVKEEWLNARLEAWRTTGLPAYKQEEQEAKEAEEKGEKEKEEEESEPKESEESEEEKARDEEDGEYKEEEEKSAKGKTKTAQAPTRFSKRKAAQAQADDSESEEKIAPAKKKQKTVHVDESDLDSLKRPQLQALAKKYSIPGNIKNDEMKERLRKVIGSAEKK
eukprot:TRINITY_DN3433_c0_g1_i1.p1 TRINITY_DN3433_c0_g1~~TRINITY_DN3433_c0_g1_i1.p1  ORF type:complete len:344 (-),score=84.26 TRINITY_DN3433_c0_g1_i1:107-1138(-)